MTRQYYIAEVQVFDRVIDIPFTFVIESVPTREIQEKNAVTSLVVTVRDTCGSEVTQDPYPKKALRMNNELHDH